MDEPNNPAGRLLAVLKLAAGANPNVSVADMWTAVLETPEGDLALLYRRLDGLMKLAGDARQAIVDQPDLDPDLYLRWTQPVGGVLHHRNLDLPWQQLKGHLSVDAIQALEFCDHQLRTRAPEKTLSDDDLRSLIDDARSLLDQVRATELPSDLKMYLTEQLWNFLWALDTYDIGGIEPLRKAFAQAIGAGVLLSDAAQEEPEVDEVKGKMGRFLNRIAVALSLGNKATQLAGSVLELTQGQPPHH